MASLRDLVTGSDACTPADAAGPSNALAGLANTFLGTSSKDQERLREIPGFHGLPGTSEARFVPQRPEDAAQALAQGPDAFSGMLNRPFDNVEEFLQGASSSQGRPIEDWQNEFQDFQNAQQPVGNFAAMGQALGPSLLAFIRGADLHGGNLHSPQMDLPVDQQCKIRDRSTILARQIYQEGNGLQADVQVDKLLRALHIDPRGLPSSAGPQSDWNTIFANGRTHEDAGLRHDAAAHGQIMAGQRPDVDRWADQFADLNLGPTPGDAMAQEFLQRPSHNIGDSMAREFLGNKFGENQWAQEFESEHDWGNEFAQMQGGREANQTAAESQQEAISQTRALAETLAASNDPKFKNSKFLQFVSKMSRGEIILEDNQAKEVPGAAAGNSWAQEFETSNGVGRNWADQFESQNMDHAWQEQQQGWADEFQAEHHPSNAWADQFAAQDWADEFLERQTGNPLHESKEYQFAENNPFLNDTDSFAKGKHLFRDGLLTEARLAFEAEVLRNPGNVDAWRLLGTVHAENDNDLQAIAALFKALAAEPNNTEVLLSLGVSFTNELDQRKALEFLMAWLRTVPGQQGAASVPLPQNAREQLRVVIEIFKSATRMNAGSADVHVALGVLLNLGRDYDSAVGAFRTALQTRTNDYSLWNKLGATLANSGRSGEAVEAYQKALDLKPNYMRAWTNMGIAQANLAEYETAARFYISALTMNPQATAVWGYLRNVLTIGGRMDLLEAVDDENIDGLSKALPL